MVGRGKDVGIALVIPQQHVEARLVLLDEVVLEHQRLGFGVGDRDFDPRHRRHHQLGLRRLLGALKIACDALLQITRLADINHLVLRIEHAIHARAMRQRAQE